MWRKLQSGNHSAMTNLLRSATQSVVSDFTTTASRSEEEIAEGPDRTSGHSCSTLSQGGQVPLYNPCLFDGRDCC